MFANRRRRSLGLLTALAILLPVSGCGLLGSDPGPDDIAGEFLTALGGGDTAAAAGRTDSPDSAKTLMDTIRGSLKPAGMAAKVDRTDINEAETTAKVAFTADWDLGRGRHWVHQGEIELHADGDAWKVHWAPTVLHPKLGAQQSLGIREEEAVPAPVQDRDGAPFLAPERVVSVMLDPAKAGDVAAVAAQLAAAVGPFDPAITQQTIVAGAGAVPAGQSHLVIALRDADYQQVKPKIYELPGVRFTAATRLLPPDRNLATQLVPGVRKLLEEQVAGKAGWRVVTVNAAGGEVDELHHQEAQSGTAAAVTVSVRVQAAAEAAIDPVPTVGAIVAIQVSTGEVLAVAQNPAADAQGAIALTGRYPPGSTFKIVTAAAALQNGMVTADTPVPCPGTMTIASRLIPNSNNFDKGTIPLHSAFAFSCNTTFAKLASEMSADTLTTAAKQFGLGIDFVIPGFTTVTGSVPPASNIIERAEDGFGQGKVVASPLGMAVAAATVASGTMRGPSLVRGSQTKVDAQPLPVPAPVLQSLRQMMREVVQVGSGTSLVGLPEMHGKTGTAQFGDGTRSHGWFAGFQGDMAFAVLVTDAGESGPALEATARFIRGLG